MKTLHSDTPPTRATLVRALQLAGPGGLALDADELAVTLGMVRRTVYQRLAELLADGTIVQVTTGTGTRSHLTEYVEMGA